MMNGGFGMGLGGGFMWIVWLLLIGLVVWAVVQAVGSGGSRSGTSQPPQKTPLQILEERYARGEIGRDEFERMKKDLGA